MFISEGISRWDEIRNDALVEKLRINRIINVCKRESNRMKPHYKGCTGYIVMEGKDVQC